MNVFRSTAVVLVGGLSVAAVGACSLVGAFEGCGGVGWYAVTAQIRDPWNRPAALGASMIAMSGTYMDSARFTDFPYDSLNLHAGNEHAGEYSIYVSKPFYASAVVNDINANGPSCSNHPVQKWVTVQLKLLPGAPPVRSVYVGPSGNGIGTVGDQVHYGSFVDADPGVSTDVRWSISDSSQATISSTGVVTGKCIRNPTTVMVTATSLADTTKKASVPMFEVIRTSC